MEYFALIRRMTLEEKCALLCGKDVWHSAAVERLGIPSITLSDGPCGLRKQAATGDHLGLNESLKATCVPSPMAIANSWDLDMAFLAGSIIGDEAAKQDVQVVLAPGMNIKRNPLCGRNFEYFSEDPYLSGMMAAGYVRGIQSHGVAACLKHFAVNNQELHRMHVDSVLDERTLRELYLKGFEIAVREGKPLAVMTSYNKVNGTYANENSHLLQDILRDEWGFSGAVVTDWGGSNDVVEGVRAGMNLEMPGTGYDSAVQLVKAVHQKRLDEKTIDVRLDQLLGLTMKTRQSSQEAAINFDQNHALVCKAAEASIVLLKNDNEILPLPESKRVAVVGDFAINPRVQGAGSSKVNAYQIDKTTDLFNEYFPKAIGYAQGFLRSGLPDKRLLEEAVQLAQSADSILLYLGLPEQEETEGLDRTHMRLPNNQIELLEALEKVNQHLIVVITAGCAVEMPWLHSCEALVYGGLLGQGGARAILNILSGRVCPSGKLAETIPLCYEDVPSSRYFPGQERTAEYREGLFVGYRAFSTTQKSVQFPFGYGLSYTKFDYSNLEIIDGNATFTITNTGTVEGAEVAQLYVSLPGAKIFRPGRELKGFVKVRLLPGESKQVRILLNDTAFRYFNIRTKQFEIETGDYSVAIGASAEDIRLETKLTVQGTNAPDPYAGLDMCLYEMGDVNNVTDEQFCNLLDSVIPPSCWDRHAPLERNDMVCQLVYARNPLARLVGKLLKKSVDRSIHKGKPSLNLLFVYNITFRGIAKLMNGMVSVQMVDDLLVMINGHGFRGLSRLIQDVLLKPNINIQR